MDPKIAEELAVYRTLINWATDLLQRRGAQTWTQGEGQFMQDTQRTLADYPDRPMPSYRQAPSTLRRP